MAQETIKKASRKEFLIGFYNQHLGTKVAAEVGLAFHRRIELSGKGSQGELLKQAEKMTALQKVIDGADEYLELIESLIQEEEKA